MTVGDEQQKAVREAIEFALTGWGERSRVVAAERDPLVRGAVARGISKHRVHVLTGIARTTIDDILSRGEGDL